jgi:hypothetical protein
MRATLGGRLAAAAGIVAVVLATAAGAHAATQTRYSLVHGCYAVSQQGRSLPGAGRVRMQATALGRYLLYAPDRRFVAARPSGAVGVDTAPGPASDWRVDAASDGRFTLAAAAGGATLRDVAFTATSGCADYPTLSWTRPARRPKATPATAASAACRRATCTG